MKAIAVFPKDKQVRLIDHPEPRLASDTDVKIRMRTVGVCGTDREIWNFDYGTPPPGSPYLITGHESLGEVVETGSKVTGIRVGDLVVPTVRRGCPEQCPSCAQGKPDFCFTGNFTERGIKEAHGYMTEFVVEDARYLNVLDPALKDVGVLLEPLTITEKALLQITLIQSRLPWTCRNAIVLGSGAVGLLAAMAFRLKEIRTIVVARSKDPGEKVNVIDAIGAAYLSSEEHSPSEIAARLGNVDLVLEATGAAQASFEFLQVLGTNGLFVFTGVPAPHKDATLDEGSLMRNIVLKNQVVLGTVNAPREAFQNGARDLAEFKRRWPKELAALITARRKPEDIDAIRASRDGIKTVIDF